MAKFGIGVGEEFPVDEATQSASPPESDDSKPHCRSRGRHRFDWVHFGLHMVFRLAIIALVAAAAFSLLDPHHYAHLHGFYLHHYMHMHGFYPYPHYLLFPILLIVVLFALTYRRHHWHRRRHWHGGPRRPDGGKEV